MKKNLLSIWILMLSILAMHDQSLLFAETYQWTDANGSIHFSDNPMNAPKGKQPIVRHEESSTNPSLSLRRPAPPVPINYSQTSKAPPSMEPACNQEYKDAEKNCEPSSNRFRLKNLSPDCQRQVEKKNSTACKQELVEATQVIRSEKEQCVHKQVSPRCKEQFDKMMRVIEEDSNKAKKCMDTRQKIYRICGYPQKENWKCHMEYMAELEAACKL